MSFLNMKKNPIQSGVAFGMMLSTGFWVMPPQKSKLASSIFIGVMGGVYWGFAVCKGKTKHVIQETVATTIYMNISMYVLQEMEYNPEYIGIGIAAHGIYDLLQHFQIMPYNDHVPYSYGLSCAVADIIIGASVYLLWTQRH